MNIPLVRAIELRLAVGALVVAAMIGCQSQRQPPNRAIAKGVVKLNGAPLKGGSIHFELGSDAVRQTDAIINNDGTYIADNVPVGEVLIGVETESLKYGGLPFDKIPLRYNDAKTSNLKQTIVLGENAVDVDLTDK